MEVVLALSVIGLVIIAANQAPHWPQAQRWVRLALSALAGVILVDSGLTLLNTPDQPVLLRLGWGGLGLLAAGAALLLVNDLRARQSWAGLLAGVEARLTQVRPAYDPSSLVHTTAVALALLKWAHDSAAFIALGGLAGVAAHVANDPLNASQLLFNGVLHVLLALLGVGLFLRRSWQAAGLRLGLRWPTRADWVAGLGAGVALYGLAFLVALVDAWLTPPDLWAARTAAARAMGSALMMQPGLILLMTLTAALGEEILYRGALQPVLGIGLTTLLFAGAHLQYTLTPTSIIIWGVGLGLAGLRQRYSTSAAIIAHGVYNALPYLLLTV